MEAGGIIWLYRDEGYPFPSAIDAIHRAKEAVGIEKLMWGSDWPRTMIDFTYRQSIDFLRKDSSLTDPEKTMLLGGNAAGLYRLPEPQIERRAVRCVTED
jgi:predicted TIM-barrel fold metal-dependent hydrolase